MSQEPQVTWLTQEAFDRRTEELEQLSGPARLDIAKKIEAAREEGDLKENGGYHAAKEEQGKIEARIRSLTLLLRHAKVGEAAGSGTVAPGSVVVAKVAGDEERFLLGSREIVDEGTDLDVYSEQSPLGAAIIGLRAGQKASYTAPNGREIEVEVVSAEPFSV